jgi:inorganic pyrophosphatase
MEKIKVYIETEQYSNIKYKYDKISNKLIIDNILDEPFKYPYSFGFIPDTITYYNNKLDAMIISNKKIKSNEYYDVYIIGCLVMENENGMDEKILCVFEEDYKKINNISDLNKNIKDNIYYFFSNYKKKTINNWSKIIGFINKDLSIELYKRTLVKR